MNERVYCDGPGHIIISVGGTEVGIDIPIAKTIALEMEIALRYAKRLDTVEKIVGIIAPDLPSECAETRNRKRVQASVVFDHLEDLAALLKEDA